MRLFDVTDEYCKQSNWKILTLLKFCLFAMGIMVGMQVPKKKKKTVYAISGLIFTVTYIPLMAKFFQLWLKESDERED